MEITCIILLIALIRGVASAIRNRHPVITSLASATPESLCSTCAYAHIAQGFRERQKLIACTFGGSVRALKFAVSTCTLYCNRNVTAETVRVIGFGEQTQPSDGLMVAKAIQ